MKKGIAAKREEIKKTRQTSLEDEVNLRGKKRRGEMEVDKLVKDYDTDILAIQEELDSQVQEYDKENKRLETLSDHFDKVDLERQRKLGEEEVTKARTNRIAKEEEKKNEFAALIQAVWRGLLQREEFVKLRKAKKKGGAAAKKKK